MTLKVHRDHFGDFYIIYCRLKIFCKHKKATIAGENAKEIIDAVLRFWLFSRPDHAAYLDRDLVKLI